MRFDLLIILLGIILIAAMILTLLFGREYSRHGYGATGSDSQRQAMVCISPL